MSKYSENRAPRPLLRLSVSDESNEQLMERVRALGLATTILSCREVNVRGYHAQELANLVLNLLGGEEAHSGVGAEDDDAS